MITYSIIQKSQLEGALRLDAEYYTNPTLLGEDFYIGHEIVEFVQYGTSKELNEEGLGYPVLRLNEFDGWFIESPAKYCDKINAQTFEQLKLKRGDILICRTNGNPQLVGKAAIVLDGIQTAFASYLFRVRPKSDYINSETLVAYLNSRFGRQEIEKHFMVSNQTNFSPAKFKEIKIPKFSSQAQNEIKELVSEAYQENAQSKSLYSQAEGMLLEELGLSSFAKATEDEERFCIVNFSEIKAANRMDAEYFQPKYEKLISKLKSQNAKSLKEIFSIRRGDFIDPDYYVKKAKRAYIRIKELPTTGGVNEDAVIYISDSFREKNIDTLQENDFVFAGIGATLGKVARITEEFQGSFYSNNTARFRLKKEYEDRIDPRYLQLVLQSTICQLQFEKRQAQTAQAKIADEELQTVLIPILAKETQQKIAELVRQSHESRKKAKQLLEEAKRKVEEMIESQSR